MKSILSKIVYIKIWYYANNAYEQEASYTYTISKKRINKSHINIYYNATTIISYDGERADIDQKTVELRIH